MRLAIVTNAFPKVSETFVWNKVQGLRQAGLDVRVITHGPGDEDAFVGQPGAADLGHYVQQALLRPGLGRWGGIMAMQARHPRVATHVLREARARYADPRRALRAAVQALPFRAKPFDLIHFVFSGLAIAYRDALPLLRPARLLMSCRGAAEQITPFVQAERADALRQIVPEMDRVHCVSEDMLRTMEGFGLDRTHAFVNYPSIDPERFQRTSPYPARAEGPYRLVSVGRLHWKKGYEYALVALRQLVDTGHDVRYHVIGAGQEAERLAFAVHDLGLSERVTFLGRRSSAEVRAALEAADVFVLPSLSEGLSNSVLEAMAMGLPVVSTVAGGMDEAIVDGESGLLVPTRNPGALARAVETLLTDADARCRIGQAARRRVVESFTLERQIARFIEEYRSVCRSSVGHRQADYPANRYANERN